MPLPQAVCVGPMKTSTSWIFQHLKSVPEIWMCPIKELQLLDYLSENVDSPNSVLTQGFQRRIGILQSVIKVILESDKYDREDYEKLTLFTKAAIAEAYDFDWYESFFADAPQDRTVLEIAPTYSYAKDVNVAQFADRLGSDTKIIFILRNPIDRWLSLGRFDFKQVMQEDGLTDENIPLLAGFLESNWNSKGDYRENIETWEKHFPNLQFIYHEDLHAPDRSGLVKFCRLIDVAVDASQFGNIEARVNSQGGDDFPPALRTWIASRRMDELTWLADRFGERAESWRAEANALLQG